MYANSLALILWCRIAAYGSARSLRLSLAHRRGPRGARKATRPRVAVTTRLLIMRGNPTRFPRVAGAVMHLASKKWAPMGDRDTEFRLLARDFRARAEELLVRAKTVHDTDVSLKLHEIALSYQRLATRLEQRAQGRKRIFAAF